MNFVDIPKTISDELCNMGGGFHLQGMESIGEAFLMDFSPFRDERFKGSGAFRFYVTKLHKRTRKHKSLLLKRLYKHSRLLQKIR